MQLILLVDDESIVVESGKLIVEQLGYKALASTDPLNALHLFTKTPEKFDLVITDYNMPRLKGTQLASKIRKIRADIPIVLCTGYSCLDKTQLQKSGITDLILKPFSAKDIKLAITPLLEK